MDERELIKSKIDIVEFISSYIPLKKAGRNFRTTCPFHNEKTPSFTVSPERQIWKCFGCGKAGDVYGFLMEYEKMTFGEAIRTLADKVGVKLTYQGKSQEKKDLEEILFEINHLTSEFYNYVLTSTAIGTRTREYLERRGITKDSIRLFKIGYAPYSLSSLVRFLLKKGYKVEDLVKSGVAVGSLREFKGVVKESKGKEMEGEAGRLKDRFYGRLMFSLFDHRGNCVGFAGRILPEEDGKGGVGGGGGVGKYINTSETAVYHKSEVLYGFNVTKEHVRHEDSVVIVEGEIDLIKVYQAGTRNVVAIKGSALTEQQVVLLKRFTQNIKICLDTDLAGKMAALRGIAIAEKADMNIKIIEIIEGKDPDECISKDIKLWKKSVDSAVDVYDFYIKLAASQFNINDITGKKQFTEFVFPKINGITNLVVRDHYVKKLAKLMDTSEEVIIREMDELEKRKTLLRQGYGGQATGSAVVKGNRREKLEEHILSLILQSDDAKRYVEQMGTDRPGVLSLQIKTPVLQKIFAKLVDFAEHNVFTIQNFVSHIAPELHDKVDELYLKDLEFENLLDVIEKEIKKCVRDLTTINLKDERQVIFDEMQKIEEESPQYATLNEKVGEINAKLKKLEEEK
jgi:DNA primase